MSLYPNLDAELARIGVKRVDVARELFKGREATVSDRLNGKTPLLLNEAVMIRNHYLPGYRIEYLFETKEDYRPSKDC